MSYNWHDHVDPWPSGIGNRVAAVTLRVPGWSALTRPQKVRNSCWSLLGYATEITLYNTLKQFIKTAYFALLLRFVYSKYMQIHEFFMHWEGLLMYDWTYVENRNFYNGVKSHVGNMTSFIKSLSNSAAIVAFWSQLIKLFKVCTSEASPLAYPLKPSYSTNSSSVIRMVLTMVSLMGPSKNCAVNPSDIPVKLKNKF